LMPVRDKPEAGPTVRDRLNPLASSTAAANAAEVCTPIPGVLIRAWQAREAKLIASS
jgi:hypothetical protein